MLLGLAVLAVVPAGAAAVEEVTITQTVSAHVVKAGEMVKITAVVEERGDEALQGLGVSFFGLAGPEKIARNQYSSPTTTKGTCALETIGVYPTVNCVLGHLNPGESATVTTLVKVDETMNQIAGVGSEFVGAEFSDANDRNNGASDKLTASRPPRVTGSPKIKLPGLPTGCVSGNFQLRVVPTVTGVKKIAAALFLGFDDEGEGIEWTKTVRKKPRMRATVPAGRIYQFEHGLQTTYKIHIAVRKKGGIRLTRTVEFQLC